MRTDDLIRMLATGVEPVAAGAVNRRFTIGMGVGGIGALVLVLATLGPRPDLREASLLSMFWMKLAYPAAVAAAFGVIAVRLSRPGSAIGWAPMAAALPFLVVAAGAVAVLAGANPSERLPLLAGKSWALCSVFVAVVSIPAFAAAMWVLSGLAPTRLGVAGFAAGMLAGAIGAAAYAIHCDEMEWPFLAVWYSLGMLLPGAAGAVIGPRWLRW